MILLILPLFILQLTWTTSQSTQGLKKFTPDQTFSKYLSFGQVSAVDVDNTGDVYVFHRGKNKWDQDSFNDKNEFIKADGGLIEEATIIVLTSNGDIITQTGRHLFLLPHGLTVDQDQNLWLTDVALHQVWKFPPIEKSQKDGVLKTPLLTLGEKLVPGSDIKHFCKPTSVAIDSTSYDFFVADGYCNSRIMKFDKNGNHLLSWGKPTEQGPFQHLGPFNLNVPHSLSINHIDSELIVADRENARIVIYSFDGKINNKIDVRRRIYGVAYSPVTDSIYGVTGDTYRFPGNGFIFSLKYGNQTAQFSPQNNFKNAHDIAVSPDGQSIYVVELDPYTIWKFSVGPDTTDELPVELGVSHTSRQEPVDTDTEKSVLPVEEKENGAVILGLDAAGSMGANQLAITVVTAIVLIAILAVSCHVYRKREKTSSIEMKGLILSDEEDRAF